MITGSRSQKVGVCVVLLLPFQSLAISMKNMESESNASSAPASMLELATISTPDADSDRVPLVSLHGDASTPTQGGRKSLSTGAEAAGDEDHHGAGPPGSANTTQMVINIIISFVGAGLLGQPHAFMESGWLLGGLALLTVSALNVYSMLRLPAVQQALLKTHAVDETIPLASYSDIGRAVMGPKGETAVIVCLGISQAGFATAYIIFIAANLFSIARVPRFWVCLACIPGLVALVQFRDLKSLSPFSLLANLANFCALSAVLFQDYESYEPHNDTIHPVKWGGLLYVIAITIYSMEGVGLILSLKASYQKPQKFGWLLSTTIAVISIFMALFGAAGYWAFGNDTDAPITLNLTSNWSATFVKLSLCLGLYLTYPIMMFPIWNICESMDARYTTDPRARLLLRGGLVAVSASVAYAIPNFGKFLSLVGSSICTLLGFVFPCYFHLKVLGKELPTWQYVLDASILIGGCIFGILGTFQSVAAMMNGESFE